MRRQRPASKSVNKPAPSKKAELVAAIRQRDALWALLDNIDTLDDACREHDDQFRKLTRAQIKRRFDIYNPEG
jgi:hypothetical protein